MSVRIMDVRSSSDLEQFIRLAFAFYKGNPYWAPPLKTQERSFLRDIPEIDKGMETKMFLAKNDREEVVGRIQVIINRHEIAYSGERVARFNKIEFTEDRDVCSALLDAAEAWVKERHVTRITGPCGYTNFDAAGILTDGYQELSNVSTIYNFPYYGAFIEQCGYTPCLECVEYEFTVPDAVPDKITRFSDLIKERYGLRYAGFVSPKEKLARTRQVMDLFNICHAHLPTFIPLSEDLKAYYFKKYVNLIREDYMALVVDKADRLVGFGLTLPSYTKALQRAKGSLFPLGFYYLRNASRKNDRVEMLLIGVHPDYRKKGITSMIFEQVLQKFIDNGIKKVESNPELTGNADIRNLWKEYDFRIHKKRSCYYKILAGGS